LGNKYTLGLKHSEATKEKMRQSRLGKKATPETREKMRQSQLKHYRNIVK